MLTVEIKGLAETNKALYSFSQQLGDKVVLAALNTGARYIQARIKARAPHKTGRLRSGIVVKKSKLYNSRYGNTRGVYLTLRKGKGRKDKKDAFYGRFLEDGYNVRGKRNTSTRYAITSVFGGRSGRKSLPGKSNFNALNFIKGTFESNKTAAVNLIVQATENGAKIVKNRLGLK